MDAVIQEYKDAFTKYAINYSDKEMSEKYLNIKL